jgi:hypothetical protein
VDVLQEEPLASHVAKVLPHPGPEVAGVVEDEAPAREAVALAGEACDGNAASHCSTEDWAWECLDVVPERSLTQGLFLHPGHEDGRGVGFPLDVHDRDGQSSDQLEGGMESDVEHADAGAEAGDGDGFWFVVGFGT